MRFVKKAHCIKTLGKSEKKKKGNLLTGALRPSLGKKFWKGDPVQGVSVIEACLQATCHLWKWPFFEERGCGKGSGGLTEPCFMSCLLEAL